MVSCFQEINISVQIMATQTWTNPFSAKHKEEFGCFSSRWLSFPASSQTSSGSCLQIPYRLFGCTHHQFVSSSCTKTQWLWRLDMSDTVRWTLALLRQTAYRMAPCWVQEIQSVGMCAWSKPNRPWAFVACEDQNWQIKAEWTTATKPPTQEKKWKHTWIHIFAQLVTRSWMWTQTLVSV